MDNWPELLALGERLKQSGRLRDGIDGEAFAQAYRYVQNLGRNDLSLWPGVIVDPNEPLDLAAAVMPPPSPPPLTTTSLHLCAGESVFRALGEQIVAPILSGFGQWAGGLWQDMAVDGPMLGVLRDGDLLAEAVGFRHPGVRVGKVHLGRTVTLRAAISDGTDREAIQNLLVRGREQPWSVEDALRQIGLGSATMPDWLPRGRMLTADLAPSFCDLIGECPVLSARVGAHCAAQRDRLLTHLRHACGGDTPHLGLLDVGYAGNVQRALQRACTLAGVATIVHGFYLVTTPGVLWAARGPGRVHGYLANYGAPGWFAESFIRHRDVVEALLAAPGGGLVDYTARGQAITGTACAGAWQLDELAEIRTSALGFLAEARDVPDRDALRRHLLGFLLRPGETEARALGGWLHADDTLPGGMRTLAACEPPFNDFPLDAGIARQLCLWPAAANALSSWTGFRPDRRRGVPTD